MPKLLPDWLPWIRPAGRLLWGIIALIFGLLFVMALIKRPIMKRPFSARAGYVAFPVIFFVGVILVRVLTPVQTLMVWLTGLSLIGLALFMVATSIGRPADVPATWAESFVGAVGVFALFILGFAIIPSEWLNYANAYLLWGDTTKSRPRMTATAIVSPRARPRPSMDAPMSPPRPNGSTTVRIICALVAPRARAPSRSPGGARLKTSRATDATMGTIMRPMTRPAMKNEEL